MCASQTNKFLYKSTFFELSIIKIRKYNKCTLGQYNKENKAVFTAESIKTKLNFMEEKNPFCVGGQFGVTKVIKKFNTADSDGKGVTGNEPTSSKDHYLIDAPHVKIYKTPYDDNLFNEMSPSTYIVFVHICLNLETGKDSINLNYDKFMRKCKLSKVSFSKAIKELRTAFMIAPKIKSRSEYWVNPTYFFAGNRVEFLKKNYPETIKVVNTINKG